MFTSYSPRLGSEIFMGYSEIYGEIFIIWRLYPPFMSGLLSWDLPIGFSNNKPEKLVLLIILSLSCLGS